MVCFASLPSGNHVKGLPLGAMQRGVSIRCLSAEIQRITHRAFTASLILFIVSNMRHASCLSPWLYLHVNTLGTLRLSRCVLKRRVKSAWRLYKHKKGCLPAGGKLGRSHTAQKREAALGVLSGEDNSKNFCGNLGKLLQLAAASSAHPRLSNEVCDLGNRLALTASNEAWP